MHYNSDYTFDANHCITVPSFFLGYVKIPIHPDCEVEELPSGNIANDENIVQLFPNPTADYFALSAEDEALYIVDVFTIIGIHCFHTEVFQGKAIDISALPTGVYEVVINNTTVKKLIKL